MIRVLAPGPFTSVQDLGRQGYYALGIPPSGPVDDWSFQIANALVGNREGAAALEITMAGPDLFCQRDCLIAVTGGECPVAVGGAVKAMWRPFVAPAGSTVSMGHVTKGSHAYLAVAGGIDVPKVLGSRSTNAGLGIGGLQGRPLRVGDQLRLGLARWTRDMTRWDAIGCKPALSSETEIRIVLGPHEHLLTQEGREALLSATWLLSPRSNRVGLRFEGPTLDFVTRSPAVGAGSDPSNIVDAPYPVGGVHAPGGSELIVLLADAVTGGGYATLGTVVSTDRDRLGQARPGDRASFVQVSPEQATQLRRERAARLSDVASRFTTMSP